jgi:hypothetical protein
MRKRPRSVADLPDFTQPASGLPSVATRKPEPAPARPAVEPKLRPYRPVSPRLKGVIVVLTLATVAGLAALMLQPNRQLVAAKAARAEAAALAACPGGAASATPGCPGGTMELLVVPVSVLPAAGR